MTNRREIIYIDCSGSDSIDFTEYSVEDSDENSEEESNEGSDPDIVAALGENSSEESCSRSCFPAYTCEWCMPRVPDIPHPSLEVFFRFELKYGRSLKTTTTIEPGEYIADYKGKWFMAPRGGPYVMEVIKGKMWIDGAVGGNISCWINHSCAPNCEVYVEPLTHRVMIFALKRIPAGNELTFRYSKDPDDLPFDCQCEVCLAGNESEEH